jgi:hypothetical protein
MSDPISRLEVVRRELDRCFGDGHAAAHPELVIAVMNAASSEYAAQLIARAIEHVAEALLVEEEEASGIMQPRQLLSVRA